ncbi:hypothetical protein Ahy_A09g042484 isoform C [Arachis hypogaea]|uniref:Uncharacterized protein n=1 Tax=Arachis hypogaea TaxID=3818 RepID=A0A445BG42_ARAHY|nr:hypothetical protein Ahy_A09g042484 isoform C [Arachis hypogaea]
MVMLSFDIWIWAVSIIPVFLILWLTARYKAPPTTIRCRLKFVASFIGILHLHLNLVQAKRQIWQLKLRLHMGSVSLALDALTLFLFE